MPALSLMGRMYSAAALRCDNLLKDLFFHQSKSRYFSFREMLVIGTWLRQKKVSSGPFAGMKYPELAAFGSTLFPKLCGTYERCLHPFFQAATRQNYREIINIGCAEGYYAVGLALLLPGATVVGFDPHAPAADHARRMAVLNGVAHRIRIEDEKFTRATLSLQDPSVRSLWVVDCEGDEKDLFQAGDTERFRNADLVIELHDFIHPNTGDFLRSVFEASHRIEMVAQAGSLPKLLPFLPNARPSTVLKLTDEKRPVPMEWLILKSKRFL